MQPQIPPVSQEGPTEAITSEEAFFFLFLSFLLAESIPA